MAEPIKESLQIVERLREERATAGRSPTIGFARKRKSKYYEMDEDPSGGKSAKLNNKCKDFVPKRNFRDSKVSVLDSDLAKIEEHLKVQMGRLNLPLWITGTIIRLWKNPNVDNFEALRNQALETLQKAISDLAFENAVAINNVVNWRREAFLRSLPGNFTDTDRKEMLNSPFFKPYLFDDDKLKEIEDNIQKRASRALEMDRKREHGRKEAFKSPLEKHPHNKASSSSFSSSFSSSGHHKKRGDRRRDKHGSKRGGHQQKKKQE